MRIGGTEPKAKGLALGPMRKKGIDTLIRLPGRLPVARSPTLSIGTDVITILLQQRRILRRSDPRASRSAGSHRLRGERNLAP